MNDWSNQYQQTWTTTPKDRLLHDLAKEYHETCEAYDRTVCTGPMGRDGIMPMNYIELRLINRNAAEVRAAIVQRAEEAQLGITSKELQDAIFRYETRI